VDSVYDGLMVNELPEPPLWTNGPIALVDVIYNPILLDATPVVRLPDKAKSNTREE
jgi:hypothetical protein